MATPFSLTKLLCALTAVALPVFAPAQSTSVSFVNGNPRPNITTPKQSIGFNMGDDFMLVNYDQIETYLKKLAGESDRMKLVDIGPTEEGRHQYMVIVSSPENLKKLDHYKEISARLSHAEGLTDDQAHALAEEGRAVVWIDGGLHASETVGFTQLVETIYELNSFTDPETMRFSERRHHLARLLQPGWRRPRRQVVHARIRPGQARRQQHPAALGQVHRP